MFENNYYYQINRVAVYKIKYSILLIKLNKMVFFKKNYYFNHQ